MAVRLDSRLSRRLLDDGLLDADQVERAAEQQLLHGGALDTILLELDLLDEATLARALSEAWATAPVAVADLQLNPERAPTWIPARTALKIGICPYAEDDSGLYVLCAAPLDRELLDEMSVLLRRDLVPRVVPEVRLKSALSETYLAPLDERYAALLKQLGETREILVGPAQISERRASQIPTPAEWTLVEALSELAQQNDREGIARVAVRYARQFMPFAALIGIRSGRAVGWERGGPSEGAQFENIPLEIPADSFLQQVLDSPSPLIGRPPLSEGNATMFGWLGRRRPRTAIFVPVTVNGRPIAVLYADGGVRPRTFDSVSDLVAFGARIGLAFEEMLRARRKPEGTAKPPLPEALRRLGLTPLPDSAEIDSFEWPEHDSTGLFAVPVPPANLPAFSESARLAPFPTFDDLPDDDEGPTEVTAPPDEGDLDDAATGKPASGSDRFVLGPSIKFAPPEEEPPEEALPSPFGAPGLAMPDVATPLSDLALLDLPLDDGAMPDVAALKPPDTLELDLPPAEGAMPDVAAFAPPDTLDLDLPPTEGATPDVGVPMPDAIDVGALLEAEAFARAMLPSSDLGLPPLGDAPPDVGALESAGFAPPPPLESDLPPLDDEAVPALSMPDPAALAPPDLESLDLPPLDDEMPAAGSLDPAALAPPDLEGLDLPSTEAASVGAAPLPSVETADVSVPEPEAPALADDSDWDDVVLDQAATRAPAAPPPSLPEPAGFAVVGAPESQAPSSESRAPLLADDGGWDDVVLAPPESIGVDIPSASASMPEPGSLPAADLLDVITGSDAFFDDGDTEEVAVPPMRHVPPPPGPAPDPVTGEFEIPVVHTFLAPGDVFGEAPSEPDASPLGGPTDTFPDGDILAPGSSDGDLAAWVSESPALHFDGSADTEEIASFEDPVREVSPAPSFASDGFVAASPVGGNLFDERSIELDVEQWRRSGGTMEVPAPPPLDEDIAAFADDGRSATFEDPAAFSSDHDEEAVALDPSVYEAIGASPTDMSDAVPVDAPLVVPEPSAEAPAFNSGEEWDDVVLEPSGSYPVAPAGVAPLAMSSAASLDEPEPHIIEEMPEAADDVDEPEPQIVEEALEPASFGMIPVGPPVLDEDQAVIVSSHDEAMLLREAAALPPVVIGSPIEVEAEAAPVPVPVEVPSPSLSAAEQRGARDLVEMLESMDSARVKQAKRDLLALGEKAVPALRERFPGALRVDPLQAGTSVETAAELSPLVEVLEDLGRVGLDAAIPHLDSPVASHRFAAVFLFVITPDERAIDFLRPRLHDQDPNIRTLAAAALSHFLAHPRFVSILEHLRARLDSPTPEARERAIALLGNFRDVAAIPVLIELLEARGNRIPEASLNALRQITLQDHGLKARAWRKWWERARKRSRVDWLIEGLRSKERGIRLFASMELYQMTHRDFGYECDAPKQERDRAVAQFESWWEAERSRAQAG